MQGMKRRLAIPPAMMLVLLGLLLWSLVIIAGDWSNFMPQAS